MPGREQLAMSAPPLSPPLRAVMVGGALLSGASLIAFLILIGLQLYRWFRDGEWTHIGTSDGLHAGLTRCCVSADSTGLLANLVHWLDTPLDWLGVHRVLELIPASLTLFALSILGNFVFLYCRDRGAAQSALLADST